MGGRAGELAPYLAPEAREERFASLALQARGELFEIGRSVEGRPIRGVRLAAGRSAAPKLLFVANIHGPEYVSGAVALGFLERVEALPALRALRAEAELVVIPCLNPDGYARVFDRAGRGKLRELRPNAHGVDLNRNFPLPAGKVRRRWPGAGSTNPKAATYVGPAPLSEPESAALARFCREQRFAAAVSGHSFMGRVIPAHVETRAEFDSYRKLCRALAAGQPHVGYGRLSSRRFDTFTGELEDFLHHECGTKAVCLETFSLWASFRQHLLPPSLFWRFNPRDPAPWIENDVRGVAAFFQAVLALGAG